MSRARATARYIWSLLREAGPKAAFASLRGIARSQVYATTDEIILRKDLDPAEPATNGIRFEDADARHLAALAEFNRRQSSPQRTARFASGLANGRRAILGFRGDELIGYFWWHDASQTGKGFYLARYGLELGDDEVYGYDLFIAPEHRGRGTPVAFVTGVESRLARMGYRRMYGFVDRANVPARWLWQTCGHESVSCARTRRILRRFMIVDGRGLLVVGRHGPRPLALRPRPR